MEEKWVAILLVIVLASSILTGFLIGQKSASKENSSIFIERWDGTKTVKEDVSKIDNKGNYSIVYLNKYGAFLMDKRTIYYKKLANESFAKSSLQDIALNEEITVTYIEVQGIKFAIRTST